MRKLSLDLDALSVESFDPAPPARSSRGTVHGHATWHHQGCTMYVPCNPISTPTYTEDYTCDDPTCYQSCDVSCGGTCNVTCTCETAYVTCAETCQQTVPC
jgi:hypothetical protein